MVKETTMPNRSAPEQRGAQRRRRGPPARRKQRQKKDGKQRIPQMVDIHIRVGLEDELVRLSPQDWFKVLNCWMLAGEDIIIRIPRQKHEMNIVLRGTQSGAVTLRGFDPQHPLPQGIVMTAEEVMTAMHADNNAQQG